MTEQDDTIIAPHSSDDATIRQPEANHPEPTLPLMPLRNLVMFPGMIQSLAVGRHKSLALTQQAALSHEKIFLVAAQRETEEEDPPFDALYHVGCTVRILKLLKMPDGTQTTVVQGIARARIRDAVSTDPFFVAHYALLEDQIEPGKQLDALVMSARQLVTRMAGLSSQVPDEAAIVVNNLTDPGQIADFVVANLNYDADRKQQFLEELDVRRRLEKATELMGQEIEVLELARKIQTDVKTNIDKTQREYFLREQMKAIQQELGGEDERGRVITDLKERLDKAGLPDAVRKEADRELQRLEATPVQAPDFSVSRTYLEYLADLPWNRSTGAKVDLRQAEEILNADHYGLLKVKKRILEFLAVNRLKGDMKGPILCLVGPPGVGKTSLGRSVARATGRRFVRISLGGVRDEAEIRGHRRTYVGALPGRIIQELRKAEANDPVFMLDEIDKLGADFRGDPTSALLEVLDPEQNASFTDHYLDVPFDLSKVMFITTANILDPIPAALLDRMEVINLPGYTEAEKLHIARRYLVPRTLDNNGLKPAHLRFHDDALREIIRHYTREAGVRNLEREIAAVCRNVARSVAEYHRRKPRPTVVVCATDVESYLGQPQVMPETAERTKVPGVATGLGWTPMGGDILFIEATSMAGGSGQLIVTGQIGNVMRESAQTALSYVRSRAVDFGLDPATLLKRDVHVHVPAGAIPKDGPSAGIAILTAMVSLFSGRVVRSDTAMTGEITLRGMVLPVGGIKEKILAAARAGIRTVILPEQNNKDLAEVPEDIRRKMKFLLVRRMEEVIPLALHNHKSAPPKAKPVAPPLRAAKAKSARHTPRPTGIAARKKPQS